MRNLERTGVLIDELCGVNIEPFCSDVCGDRRRSQTLAEICRNMDICCGFRAVVVRESYPGSIFLKVTLVSPKVKMIDRYGTVSLSRKTWKWKSKL